MAASLALAATADAVTHDMVHYGSIVVQNVFRLKPPLERGAFQPVTTPPPTIELQGISTILATKKALFKVKAASPGEQDQSYILSEGQRQDGIEVKLIDEKAGSVLFDNHGTLQTLTMAENASKPVKKHVNPPTVPHVIKTYSQGLTRDEQTVLIEINRELNKGKTAAGQYPPLPPTELTPPTALGMPSVSSTPK